VCDGPRKVMLETDTIDNSSQTVEEKVPERGTKSIDNSSQTVEEKVPERGTKSNVCQSRMTNMIEPPTFVSDKKSYAEYKADLKMWSRITSLEKSVQAEMVVYRLEGHPSRIKEKITTQLGEKLQDNEKGIEELIAFLDTIYTKDEMADAWDKFGEFSGFTRKRDVAMGDFIADWDNCYYKAQKVGCEYPDMILAFKLMKDSNLDDMETKLVLTGVDYAAGKTNKNLLEQVKNSLKKFKGRSVFKAAGEGRAVKVDETQEVNLPLASLKLVIKEEKICWTRITFQ
jgi:hypothetical protein